MSKRPVRQQQEVAILCAISSLYSPPKAFSGEKSAFSVVKSVKYGLTTNHSRAHSRVPPASLWHIGISLYQSNHFRDGETRNDVGFFVHVFLLHKQKC